MPHHAIFDIPEICLHIAWHLAPADLALACRVCRSWFVPFASELWRSIKPDQWTHGSMDDALPRYSTFIRELSCSTFVPLNDMGPQCTRLTLLEVSIIGLDNIDIIDKILLRNPDLEVLSLRVVSLQNDSGVISIYKRMEYVRIVAGLRKLKKLSLGSFRVLPGALRYLLEQLPGLELLTIEGWTEEASHDLWMDPKSGLLLPAEPGAIEEPQVTDQQSAQQLQQLQWQEEPLPRSLRSFHADDCLLETIVKVIQVSPLLESLLLSNNQSLVLSPELTQFCQQLRVHCPRLNQFSLYQSDVDIPGLQRLFSAYQSLKYFRAEDISISRHNLLLFLSRCLDTHHESLEEIYLDSNPGFFEQRESSNQVLKILRSFPALKKVSLGRCTIDAEEMVEGCSVVDGVIHNRLPFVCQNLELLQVTIRGPDRNWAPPHVFADEDILSQGEDEDEDEDERHNHDQFALYDKVMDQLCKLPNLDTTTVSFTYKF
ncbi:hypothetical protein EDD21DRAFT_364959 [Dissophora ornata]|nr:hypothetical protein BGZ58_010364 [Dissophora ornata]KAI8604937.1 hypothetical protein EDD21DRAFT_364959 [Dissophora ornata]